MTWQPIKTAPKDGTAILLSDGNGVSVGCYSEDIGEVLIASDKPYWEPYDYSYWDQWDTDNISWLTPTHWMPLPPPPVKKGLE